MKLTTTHLIDMIAEIPQNVPFGYVNPKSHSLVELTEVNPGDGSVSIKRTTKNDTVKLSKVNFGKITAISDGLLENTPISIDDLLRNNDNVRSAIEAILVRTSEIYTYTVKNHKNMVWVPTHPHAVGEITALSPSLYSILRERTVKSFDDKLLKTATELMKKQLEETQNLIKSQNELMGKMEILPSTFNTEKLSKILNEQLSKTTELRERQETLHKLLTK